MKTHLARTLVVLTALGLSGAALADDDSPRTSAPTATSAPSDQSQWEGSDQKMSESYDPNRNGNDIPNFNREEEQGSASSEPGSNRTSKSMQRATNDNEANLVHEAWTSGG